MVTASYVPLLALLVAPVLGAATGTAATVALIVASALPLVHGWAAGRASQLRGRRLVAVTTLVAGAFGVMAAERLSTERQRSRIVVADPADGGRGGRVR